MVAAGVLQLVACGGGGDHPAVASKFSFNLQQGINGFFAPASDTKYYNGKMTIQAKGTTIKDEAKLEVTTEPASDLVGYRIIDDNIMQSRLRFRVSAPSKNLWVDHLIVYGRDESGNVNAGYSRSNFNGSIVGTELYRIYPVESLLGAQNINSGPFLAPMGCL